MTRLKNCNYFIWIDFKEIYFIQYKRAIARLNNYDDFLNIFWSKTNIRMVSAGGKIITLPYKSLKEYGDSFCFKLT